MTAARFLSVYLSEIMKSGEKALSSSLPVLHGNLLRVIYADQVWLLFFLEPARMFICEQGYNNEPKNKIQITESRLHDVAAKVA